MICSWIQTGRTASERLLCCQALSGAGGPCRSQHGLIVPSRSGPAACSRGRTRDETQLRCGMAPLSVPAVQPGAAVRCGVHMSANPRTVLTDITIYRACRCLVCGPRRMP
jgi:hypothetical protein